MSDYRRAGVIAAIDSLNEFSSKKLFIKRNQPNIDFDGIGRKSRTACGSE